MQVSNQSLTKNGSGQIAKRQTFSSALQSEAYQKLIHGTLSDPNRVARFCASITSAVALNPALKECEYDSIVASALLGESLQLSPSPQLGQYYLVPYKDNKSGKTNATFQLGYKGMIQLAIRSGFYKKLVVLPIKRGEFVSFNPMEEELVVNVIGDDDEREAAETVGYYAMFEYMNGFRKAIYWSKEKMMRHADKYSKAFKIADYEELQKGNIPKSELWKYSSFYYTDFDSMACKTMLRQLISKWGIMSIEMQTGIIYDQSTPTIEGNQIGSAFYPDSPTGNPDIVEETSQSVEAEEKPIEEKKEQRQEQVTDEQQQTVRRGRPPKVVQNVVPQKEEQPQTAQQESLDFDPFSEDF